MKHIKTLPKIFRQMTTHKLKNSIFSLLLVSILFTSCNGQIPTTTTTNNTNSIPKKEQHPKIVRTLGAYCENVGCQLLDKDGNLWFSISGEGVYRYDGKLFTNFTTKDGLCNNNVGAIIQDKTGNILIGTKNGICKYDGNEFTKYPVPETLRVTCMLEDRDGNLWFGTMGNGIYRYNGTTLDNFLNNNDQIFNLGSTNQLILDILQDKNGNIWFSSWNGGGVWRYDGKDFKNFLPSADYYKTNQDKRTFNNPQNTFEISPGAKYALSEDHITDDMIFSMTEDHSGNIWFATRNHGICYYNGKIFTSIAINEGFDSGGATAILQDDKNNFWITTWDQGVWYYDGKTFENFTENDGLVGNAVMSVLKDKDGNIWFGTKWFGLSRYDGKSFTTFSQNKD
jgi:ligand-binding sensor domain-containing protein